MLHIAGIQFDIKWEDKEKNIEKIEDMISSLKAGLDLLILPEMFTTAFSMRAEDYAETMDGESIAWMRKLSEELNVALCGSLMIYDKGIYRNRFVWVERDKEIEFYDKAHPFCLIEEAKFFEKGSFRKIIEYKGWRIFPSICYDLRFPVWLRNDLNYDLLINVANWPAVRSYSWKQFLSARALENQSYVAGINRVGKDIYEMPFSGDSRFVSYDGKALSRASEHKEEIIYATLSKEKLDKYRNSYPFLKDMDQFSLK